MKSTIQLMLVILSISLCLPAFAGEKGSNPPPTSTEKMSGWEYGIGGVLGVYPGFGLGHVVQGRWQERGWIMTVGELASLTVLAVGVAECTAVVVGDSISGRRSNCSNGALVAGAIGFIGFKIWEIYDVWVTPALEHRIAFTILPPINEQPVMAVAQLHF